MDCLSTIPEDVIELVMDKKIVTAGFGAGPGCICQHIEHFDNPISLEADFLWLDRWSGTFKRARLVLEDGVTLWFYCDRYGKKTGGGGYLGTFYGEDISPPSIPERVMMLLKHVKININVTLEFSIEPHIKDHL